jgi:hypothetical protein
MEKSHKKRSPNTPPSTGTKRRRSPRQHNAMVHKRGSGPVGRGVKMRNIEGRGRAFSSSSELESDNDDDSSEEDEHHHEPEEIKMSMSTTRVDLLRMLREKEQTIRKLQMELDRIKNKAKPSKKSLREIMKWSGEEINFSDSVNTFVGAFLFPRYKFLKDGWQNYRPDKNDSLSLMCLRKLSLPEGSEADDVWERVIVPTIQMKYINLKGNMNNDLKRIYLSMMCFVMID